MNAPTLTRARRRGPSALWLAAVMASSALCSSPVSLAHELSSEREMVLQLEPRAVVVMLSYTFAPGEDSDAMMMRYDADLDGRLDGREVDRAGSVALRLALDGIELEVLGERPAALKPEIKFKRDERGQLVMLALLVYELPVLKDRAERTLQVRLRSEGARDIALYARTLQGLRLTTPRACALLGTSPAATCEFTARPDSPEQADQ